MRGNSHVQCEWGEKLEITSKAYLSISDSEQSQFIYAIAKHHNNICIVGDDDQTIYSWRKADIKNILLFHEHFPNTKDIIFEENYRSSKAIVNLTDHLIRGNKTRMDKNIIAASAVVGKQPVYTQIDDFSQLLPSIELLLKDYEPMDIAIISRKNGSLEKVESILNSSAIPVRFQVSYLRDHPSFNKIYNLLQITYEFDTKNDVALYKALSDLYNYTPTISRNSGTSLYHYLETLEDKYFKDFVEQQLPLIRECSNTEIEEALFTLMNVLEIEETDVVYKWVLDSIKDEEYTTLQQLYNRMKEIDLYNEDISIEDEGANCVNLITAHGSKGKEYPVVILLDINEFTKDNEEDEEARRILYVALTRAKKELYIFDKATKKQPSPFAAEIQEYLSSTTSAVS